MTDEREEPSEHWNGRPHDAERVFVCVEVDHGEGGLVIVLIVHLEYCEIFQKGVNILMENYYPITVF